MSYIRRLQTRICSVAPHVQVVAQVLAAGIIGVLKGTVVRSKIERHFFVHLIDVVLISFEPLKVQLITLFFIHLSKLLSNFMRVFTPHRVLIIDTWDV